MRDLLLLLIVGIMFVFGYFVMGRLDRFLNALHVDRREDETENLEPDEVENPCFRCYNSGCKDRLRYRAPPGRRINHGDSQTKSGAAYWVGSE